MSKVQYRGNCQACGRLQAVTKGGLIAYHGYTTKNGFFQGTCSGSREMPMQHDISYTHRIIDFLKGEIQKLEESLEILKKVVSLDSKHEIHVISEKINFFNQHIKFLNEVSYDVHGQELVEINMEHAIKAPILIGEKKVSSNGKHIMEAYKVQGHRVFWKNQKDQRSWTSTRSWRSLEDA